MTEQDRTHHLAVGDRAHRIVAAMVRMEPQTDRASYALALTRCAGAIFDKHPIESRPREAFLDAVTSAGVYLQRFRPTTDWTLVATELQIGRSRLDLVHEHDSGAVVIDELKLGRGRVGESAVREQIDRYVECGRELWDSRFVGVRLCSVHEPRKSRLFRPSSRRSSLLIDASIPEGLEVR